MYRLWNQYVVGSFFSKDMRCINQFMTDFVYHFYPKTMRNSEKNVVRTSKWWQNKQESRKISHQDKSFWKLLQFTCTNFGIENQQCHGHMIWSCDMVTWSKAGKNIQILKIPAIAFSCIILSHGHDFIDPNPQFTSCWAVWATCVPKWT